MEQSYYNVIVPLETGGSIIYNVKSESMMELTGHEFEILERGDLDDASPLARALHEAGMLVKSAEAQADELLYLHNSYRYNTETLDLTIMPTRSCNCVCDYCYVTKRPSKMSPHTQDLVMEFIKQCHEEAPFKKLRVSWYGGEPLLAIDVVEALSARMMAFCEERGIRYHGHMLTNGLLADATMCERLVQNCGMVSIMPTISGNGRMHEWQRPARNGEEYFDTFIANVGAMRETGMLVRANYVVNHNNFDECNCLSQEMCHKKNMYTRLTRTFAYGREGMVLRDGKDTPLELFARAEFSPYYARFFRDQGLGVAGYQELLTPQPLYCAAWVNRQFYIDDAGLAYACMIDMDYPEYALFDLETYLSVGAISMNFARKSAYMNMEPARDEECRTCRVLPICQGGCAFWRIEGADVCHDLKDCIEQVVLDYYDALQEEGSDE